MDLDIKKEELSNLISDKEIVVIDFWAPWCGPCKTLGPIIEDVAESNTDDNVSIVKINVEENTELAKNYGVRSIPTIVYIKEGVTVDQTTGIQSQVEIEKKISGLK